MTYIKTIKKVVSNDIIIEKSKFIAYLFPVHNKLEIQNKLAEMKKEYKDATHICYAYIINEFGVLTYKSFDDGEPSSTAGAPILNVLKKNDLENILCIVIRYFGGIKLGAGGLCRAYSKSCLDVLKKAELIELHKVDVYKIIVNYENEKKLFNRLKQCKAIIINKKYDLQITYLVIIKEKDKISELMNEYDLKATWEKIDSTWVE